MKVDYQIDADYETTKHRAVMAILETLYGIRVQDLAGSIVILKDGAKVATVQIEEK